MGRNRGGRPEPDQGWPHHTLTSRNGLPCNTIHWTIEDDDRSFWMYTACGLVRITHGELDAWIADPARRIETKVWDAADGVRLHAVSPASYGPPVAKSADGKLWFVIGRRRPRRRSPSSSCQHDPASGLHRAGHRRRPDLRRLKRLAPAAAHPRPVDGIHGAEPRGAGEGAIPLEAGGP